MIGPVVDIRFAPEELPELYNAIEIRLPDRTVVLETVQQTGGGVARCIALSATDGISRGMEAWNTGASITMPFALSPLRDAAAAWVASCVAFRAAFRWAPVASVAMLINPSTLRWSRKSTASFSRFGSLRQSQTMTA